jgi:ABC-type multidrug transport system fused ATPase/permease subunit
LNFFYQKSSILGVSNKTNFLFFLGVVVFLFLIISLTIRAITTYAQTRFSLMREYSISKKLLELYLGQPYTWFLNRNSADLGKQILSEVNTVVNTTILSTANLIAQSAVALALLILLILTDTVLAICIGLVLIISYLIVYYLIKSILSKIGVDRIKSKEVRYLTISEAFGAFKQIKLGSLEKIYINRFQKPAKIYANTQSLALALAHIPRFFIEAIAFGGMITLVLFMIYNGKEFANIIPIIGLYAFAGYRLIPALQNVYFSLAQIRFSKPALDTLHQDLTILNFKNSNFIGRSFVCSKSIKLENVSYNYPDSKYSAIKNVTLSIPAFSKVGFVGPTGSGKTTIIDIILGLLEPDNGSLKIDEETIDSQNKTIWQKNIGYVPQEIFLSDSSIEENIAFGIDLKDIKQKLVEEAAKIANLHNFILNQLPQGYKTVIGEKGIRLSGGQRQRIGIARALYNNPNILVLDEATSALDNLTEEAVMEAMNNLKNKVTIILIAHRFSTIKNCDNIFLLNNGSLVDQGNYIDLLSRNKNFNKMTNI